ncbi:MAG: PKD domain-containing protein [Bacteroidota bacterium]|nr:PKD domain-containing protein [Bacteroidota bacterium]
MAAHLKGGWIQYEYISSDSVNQLNKYKITVRQYLLCSSQGGQIDQSIYLGIFSASTNAQFTQVTINLTGTDFTDKNTFDPCLSPTPAAHSVCYRIDRYETTVDLPFSSAGYVLAVQRCCRVNGIVNVFNSSTIGITYSNTIPGNINSTSYAKNSSAIFAQKDTVIICYNSPFKFDFSATDPDGDSLSYNFCDGLTGGSQAVPGPGPASPPPYSSVPYSGVYSGGSPLGSNVTIDPKTGLISGIAPPVTGDYVIAVCANEYRNGVLIGTTKKEIHVAVGNCSLSAAKLNPSYITCNGFTMSFQNESTASDISTYLWDFGDTKRTTDTSSSPTPTYTYTDTGQYVLKLKVTATGGCNDSTTALVKVYPGFKANFSISGSCLLNPYQFTDQTFTKYGYVNSWQWKFGDSPLTTDTSSFQNPSYTYSSLGTKYITLITTNSKGCTDSLTQSLAVFDKPVISLPFHDTLICSIDTLPLQASSSGSYSWTPAYNISSTSVANPFVYPKDTTTYIVTVENNGCKNSDSVKVNVLQFITVDAGTDSSICQTDTFRLQPVSYALSYHWTSSPSSIIPNSKNPTVQPLTNTTYYVTANLGKCQANDSIHIKVYPYPSAIVSPDTSICFGNRTQLNASIVGSAFTWYPSNSLLYANTTSPIAGPDKTTAYILTVNDTIGCPKPTRDTILVTVIPPIMINAGKDTAIVLNQPLQFTASIKDSTNKTFQWFPADFLNNTTILDPIATIDQLQGDSIIYTIRATDKASGCYGEDNVTVKVFKSEPDIFIPSAFTPNGDSRNDIERPVLIGIKQLDYFRIYNRWGQLLYSTSEAGQGWDGTFNGTAQQSGTYVYMAQGTDFRGKIISKKGTVVLIR